jgi:hypothetical protein
MDTKIETWPVEHINHYHNIAFKKVCRVRNTILNEWYYEDIDSDIMFSSHSSWVYAITQNGFILKVGETGNPLGISNNHYSYDHSDWETQPKVGTQSRLGRLRKGDGTDQAIRWNLQDRIKRGELIEIWAYACPENVVTTQIVNETVSMKQQIHKQLELLLLDYIYKKIGSYPELNKGRK